MKTILTSLFSIAAIISVAQSEIKLANVTDGTFSQKSVRSVNWMKDGQFYSALDENMVVKYDVTTGNAVETLVDGNALSISIDGYSFSDDEQQILLQTDRQGIYRRSYTAIFYLFDIVDNQLTKLSDGRQSYATLSPDGKLVAFTRDNNLFYKELESGEEVAVTEDGKFNYIINGSTDWVYEEELSLTKAFAWSGDSKKIAYIRFDESAVREYNMQEWKNGKLYPDDYKYKYPKAGEDNSKVDVHVYHLATKKTVKMDIGAESDIYIPRITWTKDATKLSIQRLNRLQNQLDILHANATSGITKVILTDKSDTYVDFTFCDDLLYLDNGKHFLFSSEKSGFKHFYLHNIDGSLVNQVTSGEFEATQLVGVKQGKKLTTIYYMSTEDSPLERHLYSVGSNSKGKKKMTSSAGSNRVNMSADCKYYLLYHSSSESPLKVSLHDNASNKMIKVMQANEELQKKIADYELPRKEFFKFKIEDGTQLHGYFLKPKDFTAAKTYPVLMFQYSGPGSQQVANNWSSRAWHYFMVQQGYIIAVVDGRGTGFRGEKFKKITYKQLGKYETEDQISAAKHIGSLPFVDASRIGIWGWSYGGYMSSLAIMKGADVFKAAIAVAPVTTWRYYDTIYTERYLQRPQDNPSGYDDNSPIQHVGKLKGAYLLVHGTGDDNVHFQNAVALQNELIKAGKQFDTFYYPDLAHGLRGPGSQPHLYQMLSDFILENL
ncbi:MAG: S9 family peptidase [Cyclobacteriaceae bacterium]